MVRIWAKTMKNEKITRSIIYENTEKYTEENFFNYITKICHTFDIPTPIILKSHKSNFENFNICKFISRDFIETIDFDVLIIENAQ
ncbi:MAG: hypothetical protein WCX32_03205 [Clostridia bacterium]|jgi:hypothetical protein|nr:hypothetical protein [Clostridia bacterium]